MNERQELLAGPPDKNARAEPVFLDSGGAGGRRPYRLSGQYAPLIQKGIVGALQQLAELEKEI